MKHISFHVIHPPNRKTSFSDGATVSGRKFGKKTETSAKARLTARIKIPDFSKSGIHRSFGSGFVVTVMYSYDCVSGE